MKFELKNILKTDSKTSLREGVYYFIDVPKNIIPSRDENAQTPGKWSYWRKSNYDFFKEELGKLSHDKILLDLGAGQSDFLALTSEFNVCSVDFYSYKDIDVVCDFDNRLPFFDGVADIILLSNVLEHVAFPEKFLAECRRVLKSGGIILGSVPFMIGVHQRPYDFFRYTDIALKALLERQGLSANEVKAVSNMPALLYAISARFFDDLSKKYRFLARALWKAVRIFMAIFTPLFEKSLQSQEWPLGYLFKAYK